MAEDCTVSPMSVEVFEQQRQYYSDCEEAACLRMSTAERRNCSHARAQRRRRGKVMNTT